MKKYSIILLLFGFYLNAQTFELIGERNYDPMDWDLPKIHTSYQDATGENLYLFISEASQPRTMEYVRYNFASGEWQDISQGNFIVPGGASDCTATGLPDGSVMTVTRSFTNNHHGYRYYPDGTQEPLGDPLPLFEQLDMKSVVTSTGDYIYCHGIFSGSCRKWDGESWTELPMFNTQTSQQLELEIDSEDNLYIAYATPIGGVYTVVLKKFSNGVWEFVRTMGFNSVMPALHVVSENEIYLSMKVLDSSNELAYHIEKYDGSNWAGLGANIFSPYVSHHDIIKTSYGDLLLASSHNEMFRYNESNSTWEELPNNLSGGVGVSGNFPKLYESPEGYVYNSYSEPALRGITTVRYISENMGIESLDLPSKEITIYPNPAKNIINVSHKLPAGNYTINILDASGKLIFNERKNINESQFSVDVSSLPQGIYILNLKNGKESFTKKIIIKR